MRMPIVQLKNISDNDIQQLEQKSLSETLKWWNYVRWFSTISFLSVGIILMSLRGLELPKFSFFLILAGITLLNFVYSLWVDHFSEYHLYPYLHNFLDTLIFSLAIYITGGSSSPFIWSYLIPILTSSITIGRLAGFFATITSILALGLIITLENPANIFMGIFYANNLTEFSDINIHTLLSYACLFFLVYFISSFLANTLRQQNKTLERLNALLNEKNSELLASQEKLLQMERKAIVDRIARTIQHELNNPLAILSLNTEALIREQGGSAHNRLKPMWHAVIRMKKILAKIEKLYSYTYRDALEDIKILDLYKQKTSQ